MSDSPISTLREWRTHIIQRDTPRIGSEWEVPLEWPLEHVAAPFNGKWREKQSRRGRKNLIFHQNCMGKNKTLGNSNYFVIFLFSCFLQGKGKSKLLEIKKNLLSDQNSMVKWKNKIKTILLWFSFFKATRGKDSWSWQC